MWLIAAVVVLVATYLSTIFVAPVTFVVTGVVAVGIVFFEYVKATTWVFRGTAAPIGHLGIEPRTPSANDRRPPEPAYRSYYLGPVFHDYALAVRTSAKLGWEKSIGGRAGDPVTGTAPVGSLAQHLTDRWNTIGDYVPINPVAAKVISFAPLVGALVGLVAGVAGAFGVGLLISAAFGLVIVLTVVLAMVLAGLLRLLELAVLRVRGITIECPACHRKATAPTYLCSHCPPSGQRALHRRLVPGVHGVFNRICQCGNGLPTLLASGKYKLEGFCQHCNAALPLKSMTAPTLHLPVVAGRQAGKTVFMVAAVAGLEQQARNGDAGGFEFADPASLQEYQRARDAIRNSSFNAIGATVPVDAAPAFNIYLGAGRTKRLMYLYDVAGERLEQDSGVETLRYIEHAGGVVVIVDPFSFSDVRRVVEPAILNGVRHSLADVDDVVSRFAEGLRQTIGARAGRKLDVKAAIVLTKCDALLRSNAVPHPYDQLGPAALDPRMRVDRSDAIRMWLGSTAGQGGLLAVLENTFSLSGYFAVSARDAFDNAEQRSGRTQMAVRNDDPALPLRWLLERRSGS
ncbi:MAG: TRAFAC clade GTPase domain-containing protein [Pseudonocardia sp.]